MLASNLTISLIPRPEEKDPNPNPGNEATLPCNVRMCHLLFMLSVEFADVDAAQKVHYRPNTDNQSNYQCITNHVSVPLICVFANTAEPLYNGHHWDPTFCPL